MSILKCTVAATVLTICTTISSLAAATTTKASTDPISAIENDYRNGVLTFDQKALLQITAIKKPKELPQKYQLFDALTGRTDARSATLAIKNIKMNWSQLSPSTQATIDQALTRWATAFTYNSPGGFFKLHYDTSGANAVPSADLDADGIPDYVEKCALYCDTSYNKQMALGYLPPPSDGTRGGDSRFDIYFEEMGYYGYTVPEGPGPQPWNDYYSYLVLHRNFQGFPPNTDPEGNVAGAAKVTAAHEFHHAIQFAYNAGAEDWYMELDATYMEDIVYDQVNDNYNYLPSYMNNPETSLMDLTIHMYACFIWNMFLAEKFDTSLMVAVWQGAKYTTTYQALSDTLMGRYGWTQDSAFALFTAWNFATSDRNDGLHFQEAANYPLALIRRTYASYPVTTQTSSTNPQGYAASYIQFQPGSVHGALRVHFDGDDSRQWAAWVVATTGTNQHQFQKMVLTPGTYIGSADVPGFENYSAVTLIAVNLSENSSGAPFAFSAEIHQAYSLSSTVLTDSSVYSGAGRTFQYQVTNTSPLADMADITYQDDRGWVVAGGVSRFLASGASTIVNVTVTAPVYTPLSTVSHLQFKAVSHSDTSVWNAQARNAVTVVQRGDLDFNGVKDIADLSYIVDFLFSGGMSPKPVLESGNFDCVGSVDIGDLTGLTDFLFNSGPPPPCNPF
ncbi:MAG TPA: MXAN_6640 family putative metalloprotease [Candidatus Acidoferrum sp.]|nr:MXAN_6640 family putative metalloprotease [Candidatus Acidoferrum sp.]